jgi:hypothetical protein
MGEGEPDAGLNTRSDNAVAIKGETIWSPLFVYRFLLFLSFF